MTRSQPVAGILTVVLLIVVILGPRALTEMSVFSNTVPGSLKTTMESLQVSGHVVDFTRGIIDTRQVFFYLTGAVLALLFSILCIEAKLLNN